MGQEGRYIKDKTGKAKREKEVNGISELRTCSWLLGAAEADGWAVKGQDKY